MFFTKRTRWNETVDVVVVGTGAAGLTAALTAHDGGAKVCLLEKSALVGGTTAVSGGVIWVPMNPHMAEVGISDSREEALRYLQIIADGRTETALLERFVDNAPRMVRYLEEATPLKFTALGRYPDYHPEHDGGKPGGRSMETGLFDTGALGAWAKKLRRSPVFGGTPMTVEEATTWGVFSDPLKLPFKKLGQRFKDGLTSYGGSLVAHLLKGCLDRGIEPQLECAVEELIVDDGKVVGIRVGDRKIEAKKGVILATGGFEWNEEMTKRFLPAPLSHPNSPPSNTGDGLRMAMKVGADLGNMSEAWWCPSVVVPGEEVEGTQLNRGDFAIRSLPHSIIVNRAGHRFVNEAHNYNDMMKPFFHFDPVAYERPNLPAYLVVDQQFLDKYILVTSVPGMDPPPWLKRAETLEALAAQISVDPVGLTQTVTRFNAHARCGVDEDFRRGESSYDHFYGDPKNTPNPNLGALEKAPFYALEVFTGAIGTKGGPRIDGDARVLAADGPPIEGLYAAGNVTASPMGPGYPGAGATIGVAMTFGYLAGQHVAAQ